MDFEGRSEEHAASFQAFADRAGRPTISSHLSDIGQGTDRDCVPHRNEMEAGVETGRLLRIARTLCTRQQSNQASSETARLDPWNTPWYLFRCPSLVDRFSTRAFKLKSDQVSW
jgi:hypothetical protein